MKVSPLLTESLLVRERGSFRERKRAVNLYLCKRSVVFGALSRA